MLLLHNDRMYAIQLYQFFMMAFPKKVPIAMKYFLKHIPHFQEKNKNQCSKIVLLGINRSSKNKIGSQKGDPYLGACVRKVTHI